MTKILTIYFIFIVFILPLPSTAAVSIHPGKDGTLRITFSYPAKNAIQNITVAGNFNNWDKYSYKMEYNATQNQYEYTLNLSPGKYKYKYIINDEQWVTDPDEAKGDSPFQNSTFTIAGATGKGIPVDIHYHQEASEVYFIWGINGWNTPDKSLLQANQTSCFGRVQNKMQLIKNGHFNLQLLLPENVMLDGVFQITQPEEFWDNNGGDGIDYHYQLSNDNRTIHIEGKKDDTRPPLWNPKYMWLIATALSLILALLAWLINKKELPVLKKSIPALIICLLCICIRYQYCYRAEISIDEYAYVPIAQHFAHCISHRDIQNMVDFPYITEHPRLCVTLFASALNITKQTDPFANALYTCRFVNILFAAILAFFLSYRYPLAGLAWSLYSISIMYTSVAYYDCIMTFFSSLSVLLFTSALQKPLLSKKFIFYMCLSAICAGATVSSKYLGAVGPLAIALIFTSKILRDKSSRKKWCLCFMGYVIFSLLIMIGTDIHLWSGDWLYRIYQRITFHQQFSASQMVQSHNFPWYQPIIWLWVFGAHKTNPGLQIVDLIIYAGSIMGIWIMIKMKQFNYVTATGITLLFLLIWKTKWPQYEVVLIPWIGISFHYFCMAIIKPFRKSR